jgi:hypothetical protein
VNSSHQNAHWRADGKDVLADKLKQSIERRADTVLTPLRALSSLDGNIRRMDRLRPLSSERDHKGRSHNASESSRHGE